MSERRKIAENFGLEENIVVRPGDCLGLLKQIPDRAIQLVVTSPPYNLGKEYERKLKLTQYLHEQETVIRECARALAKPGSMCWQVGNPVQSAAIIPLHSLL